MNQLYSYINYFDTYPTINMHVTRIDNNLQVNIVSSHENNIGENGNECNNYNDNCISNKYNNNTLTAIISATSACILIIGTLSVYIYRWFL